MTEVKATVREVPDVTGCGCFVFLTACVVCATVLALAWMGHL